VLIIGFSLHPGMIVADGGFGYVLAGIARRGVTCVRRFLLLAAFFLLTNVNDVHAGGIEPDKRAHFVGGFAAGSIATVVGSQIVPEYRFAFGMIFGMVPGLTVEVLDSMGDAGFSGADLLADFLGVAAGTLITDKFILRPLIRTGSNKQFGLAVEKKF
jgi:hypothetical protein